eukprot:scaffold369440_cov98-Attheya_sp.AAC.1
MHADKKNPPRRQLSRAFASDKSSKPSSTHMDAVQRHPTPLRMMSTVSLNVESVAGSPIITDPYLYVAWSNATPEEQDNGDWKKYAKAPMHADKKNPSHRQFSRAPESAKASLHPDSDASDKLSDEEDKWKQSAKAPIHADKKKPPRRQLSRALASDESSKPSSTHMDAVQRHPTPLCMMSTVSSNVESIAGPPIITDTYLYVAWSNATPEEQDNGDWKKYAKARTTVSPWSVS